MPLENTTLGLVADLLRSARSVAVLTGAGISAESGVPTFRGAEGLWRSFRAEELATPAAFARDPQLVWDWYRWRRQTIAGVSPNPGHLALVRLQRRLPGFALVTQNVDGLHRRAGSLSVIELHGNIWRARCTREPARVFDEAPASGAEAPLRWSERGELPSCPSCGAMLRPDVVWFGEPLDAAIIEKATEAVRACDVLLIVGTSGIVYPAAALPDAARRAGAPIVEINVAETPLTAIANFVLRGPSGSVLPALEAAV